MQSNVVARNHVHLLGQGDQPLIFAHGFGSNQTAWRHQVAQAMVALRLTADNAEALTAQAAEFFSKPQIKIQDWQWRFSNPTKILSLSSTPIPLQPASSIPSSIPSSILGHLWVIEDITRREQIQESLRQQNRRIQLLAEVTLKIRQSLQLQNILQTAVTEVRTLLDADRVLVYRLWANGTGSGIAEDVLPEFPSVLGKLILSGDPL